MNSEQKLRSFINQTNLKLVFELPQPAQGLEKMFVAGSG